MKKIFILSFLLIILYPKNVFGLELDIYSDNAILYNLNDNSIIYEKNSDKEISIASMTKIMTAVVALEKVDSLDNKITIKKEDFRDLIEQNASLAGFYIGEVVTYRDLLYGLLLPSGAEAALALANNTAGSIENFVKLMNTKAKELGLINTSFSNPTGLDQKNNYSTVKEVAILFNYALQNENFKEIIKTKNYETSNKKRIFTSTISKTTKKHNLNMEYLIGGKTGTTASAGLCLASFSEYNGIKYLLVTARAPYSKNIPYNFFDAEKIYEYFIKNYSYKNIVNKNQLLLSLETENIKNDRINFYADKNISLYLNNDFDINKLTFKYIGKNTVNYSIKKGSKLGEVIIYDKEKILASIDIILQENQTFSIKKYIYKFKNQIILFVAVITSSIFLLYIRKKKHIAS